MAASVSIETLEDFGRSRLSKSFFMRDFLYSEIAAKYGILNFPDDRDLAIEVGKHLCEELLEPLNATFGRVAIRSAYRSCEVNQVGNEKGHNCAQNEKNYAGHIWDRRDAEGLSGATACIVIPWFADQYAAGAVYRTAPIPPLKLAQFLPEAAKIQLEQLSKLFTITPECVLG